MLNILKNTIRKKKLYFTINSSVKNLNLLYCLLVNNVITGFSKTSRKHNTFLIVFINYSHNFDSSLSSLSLTSKKISKQQNKIIDVNFAGSNFKQNIYINKNKTLSSKFRLNQKPKYSIKFR
jgi:ribosomal protein S8